VHTGGTESYREPCSLMSETMAGNIPAGLKWEIPSHAFIASPLVKFPSRRMECHWEWPIPMLNERILHQQLGRKE
jgi:hypothetical protein